jgi:hypothetical protein
MGELAKAALQFDGYGARVDVNYTEPWDADVRVESDLRFWGTPRILQNSLRSSN